MRWLARISATIDAVLLGQRGHLFPWAPVFLSIGIGAYFLLKTEPDLRVFVLVGLAGVVLGWAAFRWPAGWSAIGWAAALTAAGFCLAGWQARGQGRTGVELAVLWPGGRADCRHGQVGFRCHSRHAG